jgi:selenocysteine-specific elongation factor
MSNLSARYVPHSKWRVHGVPMGLQNFILATAGHVDHGKSALVKALTGIGMDRLPEEKKRGLTIDLGFAHLDIQSPEDDSTVFHIGIVDVPGHEDFVKNMVAGVGSVDLALFVIAADDGWMVQTEEHLQILNYLGVKRAVVALTKIDLVKSEGSALVTQIRERLQKTQFSGAPIVKVSVVTGMGLDSLKSAVARVLSDTPSPPDISKPRLSVDRVFTLQGIGTVVTGTLTGGSLSRGQNVIIEPYGRTARIRSIQSHNRNLECSLSGTRTALNLSHVSAGSSQRPSDLRRGDVVTLPDLGKPSSILNVLLEKSVRLSGSASRAGKPLKDGTRVRVHHGAGNTPARVRFLNDRQLSAGQWELAELQLESSMFTFAGDRFILRDWSEQATLAGGMILDPEPGVEKLETNAWRMGLPDPASKGRQVVPFLKARLNRDKAVKKATLLVQSLFSGAEIANGIESLVETGDATAAGNILLEGDWWRVLCERAKAAIDTEHRQYPDRTGLTLSKLRRVFPDSSPAPELVDALVSYLCQHGFIRNGIFLFRKTHYPKLRSDLQAAAAKIRSALSSQPFSPPSRKELAPDPLTQQALRFLIKSGEAVEISDKVAMLAPALTSAKESVERFLRMHGPSTVSEIRQELRTTRRIAVPLLELLDREGLTVSKGDKRVLR